MAGPSIVRSGGIDPPQTGDGMLATRSRNAARCVALSLAAAALIVHATAGQAGADLLSLDGPFGLDTITRDTETGLDWLDLTESVGIRYSDILLEFAPEGLFEGHRYATRQEVSTLWEHGGVSLTPAFDPEAFAAVMALGLMLGRTGDNGNCGEGCLFDFAQGFIEDTGDATARDSAGLSWNPDVGGRANIGTRDPNTTFNHGSWLVTLPEPGAALRALGALASLCVLRWRRGRTRRPRFKEAGGSFDALADARIELKQYVYLPMRTICFTAKGTSAKDKPYYGSSTPASAAQRRRR